MNREVEIYHPARAGEFSPGLLEAAERPPSPLPRAFLAVALALLGALLIWAFYGRLDIVARAAGRLIPRERLQVIQPLEGGRVREILVREGQRVRTGQILMRMDPSLAKADLGRLETERGELELQRARVRAELHDDPFVPPPGADPYRATEVAEQYRTNRAVLDRALDEQAAAVHAAEQERARARELVDKLREIVPIRAARESALARLGRQGYAQRMAVLESSAARIEAEHDLQAQRHALQAAEARAAQAREHAETIRGDYLRRLLEESMTLTRRLATLGSELDKLRFRTRLLDLKAPRAGTVKDLALHTPGSVVPAGSVLLTVVPDDTPLLAEVLVENRDVGFVAAGQHARVKLVSYEFQRYGTLDARVEQVGADALASGARPEPGGGRYRALLALEAQHLVHAGHTLALRPGMQVSAEIRLGSRSVIDYVLSPIRRAADEAGHER